MTAGIPGAEGEYPDDTFRGRAQTRIAALAELDRELHRPAGATWG